MPPILISALAVSAVQILASSPLPIVSVWRSVAIVDPEATVDLCVVPKPGTLRVHSAVLKNSSLPDSAVGPFFSSSVACGVVRFLVYSTLVLVSSSGELTLPAAIFLSSSRRWKTLRSKQICYPLHFLM